MHSKLLACGVVIAAVTLSTPAGAQDRGNMRFRGMDRNNDGTITRQEWRGSDRSFQVHDCNGDGKLSGDEVRPGGHPCDRRTEDRDLASLEFRDWSERGFRNLDHNNDSRITPDEWHFDREAFRRVDYNRDGIISRDEFFGGEDDDRDDRFANLDHNRDGRISRDEWHATAASFDRLDDNHDGVLTRAEMEDAGPPADLFASIDVNRDSMISLNEWHWSKGSFDLRDANHDGRLTRDEFTGVASAQTRGGAYRAGYERGRTDGRAAGKEDRERNQGYEPVGQRELDTADAGYEARLGPRTEYQEGYRAGFAAGYPEGWNTR
jgi:Ca2+-binding EF-hand superfamily protein